MANRDDEPSAGALFIEGASWFLAGALSMVLCVIVGIFQFFKLLFWWVR